MGDTLATALDLGLAVNQSVKLSNAIIGGRDVDLYRLTLAAGDQLDLSVSDAALYGYLRIFNADGVQQAASNPYFSPGNNPQHLRWTAPAAGNYFIGVSGWDNTTYDPNTANTGTNAPYQGAYSLGVERQAAGSRHLVAITTSAASGTPTNAGIASANTGQTITLQVNGLLASDRVVFTVNDTNGNLSEAAIAPATVDPATGTLTVVVPATALTGAVRLERDRSGLLLQVVPTISDLVVNPGGSFTGAGMTLQGSGFAEGQLAVLFGNRRIDDPSRYFGADAYNTNTSVNLSVAVGMPTGPIRVATVGGTSQAFNIGLTSITAKASVGTPANASQASANPGQLITLVGTALDLNSEVVFEVIDDAGNRSDLVVRPTMVGQPGTSVRLLVPTHATSGVVRVAGSPLTVPLQIVPVVTDVQMESVAADGSTAQVLVSGWGFTEGAGEYRFGDVVVTDAASNAGPDVFSAGTQVRLTLPLNNGQISAFGAVSVKTPGGSSAAFTVGLSAVQSVALSGTPADPAQASANAGQTVRLVGSGLTTSTDVLVKYTDTVANTWTIRLNPSQATVDGTSALLDLPSYINGAFRLQVLGSASQPLLQIVPTLGNWDQQSRLVLTGSGLVEGASRYQFTGVAADDTAADATANHIDVVSNEVVYIDRTAMPTHGLGDVTVTTAGGTSAPLALKVLQPNLAGTALGDLAVDPATGALWALDYANPGKLQRIDRANGQVLQTIDMTAAWGTPYTTNHGGLQVLDAAIKLGSTDVPVGSLLVFNGHPNPDQVVAINPTTGAVIASLALAGNLDLTAGVYDKLSGRLLVLAYHSNDIKEIDPTTGAVLASIALPAGANIQAHAGIAIDPVSGNLWIAGYYMGGTAYEIKRDGTLVRSIDLASQGLNEAEASGLAFDTDGQLLVASTQGVIYKVDPKRDWAATPKASLTQVIATAGDGTPANSAQASANVGEVIELRGANFNAGTSVLFNIRDNSGNTRVDAISPLLVSPDGTRLQVRVPDYASTGDIRVVNRGLANLGFTFHGGAWVDSIHRQVTVNFTAQADGSASIRFTDGGLEDLANESWGIDNVVVRQGAAKVFEDNFEAGAKANWSNTTTDNTYPTSFTRFSGRFGNASQTLSLSGLAAGQTYSLAFDLYAIDSWEGKGVAASVAPDLFKVIANGQEVLSESLANHPQNGEQTLNASAGIRLQVVPKLLASIGNSRPGQDDWYFYLNGTGFMEGATTITVGGVVQQDRIVNDNPIEIDGSNSRLGMVAPRSLDGPIRVATDGGWDEIASYDFGPQPISDFTGITASLPANVLTASQGQATNAAQPAAVTGQTITLTGQGFTGGTLVQFTGLDDSGRLGTLTRTGSPSGDGRSLTITVPALAKTGPVTVLGSNSQFNLQIVPTLKAIGGAITAGNTIILEGTGLSTDDLVISIDGRTVGNFSRATIVDGDGGNPDQQFITLTVPAGVSAGVITIITAGGQATLRASAPSFSAKADQSITDDVGDTLATALDLGLAVNQSVKLSNAIIGGRDVDLYRLTLAAGDQLDLSVSDAALYGYLRIFNADGVQQAASNPYFSPGNNPQHLRWTAPAAGNYFIGVSGWDNTTYDPNTANTGTNAPYQGAYSLGVERQAAGSRHLVAITTSAASGTPTNAGIASANTGQTITLQVNGLLASDRVVFTVNDTNGNLSEAAIAPATVDPATGTLTVVVPATALTGAVRLERDRSGLLLQVVPTISAFTANGDAAFTLTGTGFVEGNSRLDLPTMSWQDPSRHTGLDVFGSNSLLVISAPLGVSRSSVRVVTVGGTSASFSTGLA